MRDNGVKGGRSRGKERRKETEREGKGELDRVGGTEGETDREKES